MPRQITPATSLDNLKKEAKRWLKQLDEGDVDARARFERAHPAASPRPVLRDLQHALAREHGFESWNALREALARRPVDVATSIWKGLTMPDFDRLASEMVQAFDSRDEVALQRINQHYRRTF